MDRGAWQATVHRTARVQFSNGCQGCQGHPVWRREVVCSKGKQNGQSSMRPSNWPWTDVLQGPDAHQGDTRAALPRPAFVLPRMAGLCWAGVGHGCAAACRAPGTIPCPGPDPALCSGTRPQDGGRMEGAGVCLGSKRTCFLPCVVLPGEEP